MCALLVSIRDVELGSQAMACYHPESNHLLARPSMKIFKTLLFSFSLCLSFSAAAQRMPVPIMDFKDIPVSESASKPLTAEQVGKAIREAATYEQWEVTQVSDGVLQARYEKESKHVVIVTITYSADKYSVIYKDSTNMKYAPNSDSLYSVVYNGGPTALAPNVESDAVNRQRRYFKNNSDTSYAVAEKAVIHPYYERWVHTLLKGIRKQLQLTQ
jgi:hypothetical protein